MYLYLFTVRIALEERRHSVHLVHEEIQLRSQRKEVSNGAVVDNRGVRIAEVHSEVPPDTTSRSR